METVKMMSEIIFLALVIWREARGESVIGQTAVAYSILNRVAKPSWWGSTVMEVLFKKLQYSSVTYKNDPQLTAWPTMDPVWRQCVSVALGVFEGTLPNLVPGADSYWDSSITAPKWATKENFVKKIGRLSFHNVDNDHETNTD